MQKKNIPVEFVYQLFALIIAIIVVHAFYVSVVRPNAQAVLEELERRQLTPIELKLQSGAEAKQKRSSVPSSCSAIRAARPVRVASRRQRTRPPRRQHDLDQRRAPGLHARRGVTLERLSHRAHGCAVARATRG